MGIFKDNFYFLIYAREQGVDFTRTLMLGRQGIPDQTRVNLKRWLARYDKAAAEKLVLPARPSPPLYRNQYFAESLFQSFGAECVDSIDVNNYENATIIHDMNKPVTNTELINKYTCVYDGGTLEHIFNYPVAIHNAMSMVAPGGYLIIETPANNQYGHGFYQFSANLFFSLFCEDNGFSEPHIIIKGDYGRWYRVRPPQEAGWGYDVCPSKNQILSLRIIARKTGEVPTELILQQNFYEQGFWKFSKNKPQLSRLRLLYRKLVPLKLATINWAIWVFLSRGHHLRKNIKRCYKRIPSPLNLRRR